MWFFQARYVLAQVLIEAGVVKVTQPSEADLLVTVDRAALNTTGKTAIANFLLKLQIYKSTADVTAAQNLYDKYSEVNDQWLKWRAIVLANKQPRKIFTQANTFIKDSKVVLKSYDETTEGMIQSCIERFANREALYAALLDLSAADEPYF